MLSSARGWCVFELAISELIQLSFQERGGQYANFILPLFMISQSDPRLPRSVWQLIRDRGLFLDETLGQTPVDSCTRAISDFLMREQSLARDAMLSTLRDKDFVKRLNKVPGLFDRIVKFHPKRIPIVD